MPARIIRRCVARLAAAFAAPADVATRRLRVCLHDDARAHLLAAIKRPPVACKSGG
ncbi:hypothetical protein [Azospirillum cavernae]|uniref:hypothetical protein n=1 Tax=Azospirillum cavernae TaxID=2320860 RepID=UPI0013147675|nr:hypothetical protein [Azospirillum cavernae]